MQIYSTQLSYTARESKARYVFDKYKRLYKHNVLDVGADAQHMKEQIKNFGGNYIGIGFGSNIDINFDLDGNPLPFSDNSFETVQCLDVLEHLNDFHYTFSELIRVSCDKVIISLPNCWSLFFKMLIDEKNHPNPRLKWYGLPDEKPIDRHRWFFSKSECFSFFFKNQVKFNYSIEQFDVENSESYLFGDGFFNKIKSILFQNLFRKDINELGLNNGTIWVVLTKNK
jgi:hypothetical protein